jgi:hypothetical protein
VKRKDLDHFPAYKFFALRVIFADKSAPHLVKTSPEKQKGCRKCPD